MSVSINPANAGKGGLPSDVNVTFQKVRFAMFDYGGRQAQAVPAIHADMVTDGGESFDQYWSLGSSRDWMPSNDGKELEQMGVVSQLRQGSNGVIFLENLVSSGFPGNRLENDISVLDGLKAHVRRVPAPVRAGIKKKEGDREATILIVDEILELPKEAAETNGLADEAEEVVMHALVDADGYKMTKVKLATLLHSSLKGNENRSALVTLIGSDDFLSGDRPWKYSDGEISIC